MHPEASLTFFSEIYSQINSISHTKYPWRRHTCPVECLLYHFGPFMFKLLRRSMPAVAVIIIGNLTYMKDGCLYNQHQSLAWKARAVPETCIGSCLPVVDLRQPPSWKARALERFQGPTRPSTFKSPIPSQGRFKLVKITSHHPIHVSFPAQVVFPNSINRCTSHPTCLHHSLMGRSSPSTRDHTRGNQQKRYSSYKTPTSKRIC
jgi:hypothetical protein